MEVLTKHWHAVYTKPKWEKKVASTLERKGVEVYCPVNKVRRQWSDRKRTVYEPLFKSYVFVYVDPSEFTKLYRVTGVINLVYWLSKPAVIREEEMVTIKRFLNEYEEVSLEKVPVRVDDMVRISGGAFMDQEGKVTAHLGNKIKVNLPSLGYNLVAEVAIQNIEIIKYAKAGLRS
jgi:transcription antitermination factor NusG